MTDPVRLNIVTPNRTPTNDGDGRYINNQVTEIFVHLPLTRIGAGRHAVVFAADTDYREASNLASCRNAVKFLRKEDSKEYNADLQNRFFSEIRSLHNTKQRDGLIEYLGFGLIEDASEETRVEADSIASPEDTAAFSNDLPTQGAQQYELAGIFYVMKRARCSLDNFLYLDEDPNIGASTSKCWKALLTNRQSDEFYRWYDYTFCFQIFKKAANTVHRFHDGSSRYAHRDIKPGNFLVFYDADEITLKLSDFGGLSQAATPGGLGLTEAPNRRSSLMNQPGSRGYRAPEQRETGLAILARIRIENNASALVTIVRRDFDVTLFNGDALVLSEPALNERELTVTEVNGGEGRAPLLNPSKSSVSFDQEIHATLYRNQGQPADAFALGCLLYHLGSGGKDAERFLYSILPWALQANDAQPISCGAFASILYAGSDDELDEELQAVDKEFGDASKVFFGQPGKKATELVRKWRAFRYHDEGIDLKARVAKLEVLLRDKTCHGSSNALGFRSCVMTEQDFALITDARPRGDTEDSPQERSSAVHMLRALSRDDYVTSQFLIDTEGKAIPWSVMAMTFCLTLRGYPGSVCESSMSETHLSPIISASERLAMAMREVSKKRKRATDSYEGEAINFFAKSRLANARESDAVQERGDMD